MQAFSCGGSSGEATQFGLQHVPAGSSSLCWWEPSTLTVPPGSLGHRLLWNCQCLPAVLCSNGAQAHLLGQVQSGHTSLSEGPSQQACSLPPCTIYKDSQHEPQNFSRTPPSAFIHFSSLPCQMLLASHWGAIPSLLLYAQYFTRKTPHYGFSHEPLWHLHAISVRYNCRPWGLAHCPLEAPTYLPGSPHQIRRSLWRAATHLATCGFCRPARCPQPSAWALGPPPPTTPTAQIALDPLVGHPAHNHHWLTSAVLLNPVSFFLLYHFSYIFIFVSSVRVQIHWSFFLLFFFLLCLFFSLSIAERVIAWTLERLGFKYIHLLLSVIPGKDPQPCPAPNRFAVKWW